jgi:hypothetical protein
MCSQFNPNPHEMSFEGDFMELSAPAMKGGRFVVKRRQVSSLGQRLRAFMASPQVRALSPDQRAQLVQRFRTLMLRVRPHIAVR